MKKYSVILDLDTGIDDAVALAVATVLDNIDIRLVTAVFGNVPLEKVVKNTLIILEDVNSNIPVAVGESKPIKMTDFSVSAHGKNGLGDYEHAISTQPIKTKYLKAMHDIVCNNDMTYIISCGPLTNVAKFIMKYPELNDKVHLIAVTGLLEIDKKNPYLNFNIAKDVEACKIAVSNYKHFTLVPSDMGHLSYIPTKDFSKTAKCGRVGKIFANMYPHHLDRSVKNGAAMHDMCGVIALSNPKLFTFKPCKVSLKIVKNGGYLDLNFDAKKCNAMVATGVNVKKIHKLYYKCFKKLK